MKFYNPEIVNRWHSDADGPEADAEWEQTQDAYERHFRALTDKLPASVRKFNQTVLHDETVVSLPRQGETVECTVVTVNQPDRQLHVLVYALEKPLEIRVHIGAGFDPPQNIGVWLYDEFGLNDGGQYTHNVLLSNGLELLMTFKEMHWYECQVQEEG